jgi:thiamine kinase-like enzyme
VNLEECLPAELRGAATTITKISAGLSGAGVYRVQANGQSLVLKAARDDEPLAAWQARVHIQKLAATAGLAPRIVHVDEARRAVLSGWIADRSFPLFYRDPARHNAAIDLLGRTVRRVHLLPLPANASFVEPREFLAGVWSGLRKGAELPAFVGDAVRRVLREPPPARERALVLSHNDVNPTNLAFDGERILLLDWDTAGPNDSFYDLATIAVFLRMDDGTCQHLIAAYDGAAPAPMPARFAYCRRLVAGALGATFLRLARAGGHPAATPDETLDKAPSLGDCYQRMQAGSLNIASAEGQWSFGLAMSKTSLEL